MVVVRNHCNPASQSTGVLYCLLECASTLTHYWILRNMGSIVYSLPVAPVSLSVTWDLELVDCRNLISLYYSTIVGRVVTYSGPGYHLSSYVVLMFRGLTLIQKRRLNHSTWTQKGLELS